MYIRKCPHCKTLYQFGTTQCKKCRCLLPFLTTYCQNPACSENGKPIPADVMACPKCHMETKEGEAVRRFLD